MAAPPPLPARRTLIRPPPPKFALRVVESNNLRLKVPGHSPTPILKAISNKKKSKIGRPQLHDTSMVTIICNGHPWRPSRLASDGEIEDPQRGKFNAGGDGVDLKMGNSEAGGTQGYIDHPTSEDYEDARTWFRGELFNQNSNFSNSSVTRTFQVHKTLACAYSRFFKAAFNGNFMEGETQTVTLQVNPHVASILIRWMYAQQLHTDDDDGTPIPSWHFLDLWLLGDYLMIPDLQDDAMIMYMATHEIDNHCSWILNWIWKATQGEDHPLRRLMIEEYSLIKSWEVMLKQDDMPKELLAQLLEIQMAYVQIGGRKTSRQEHWDRLDPEDFFVSSVVAAKKHSRGRGVRD